jgi:hypothetical protein
VFVSSVTSFDLGIGSLIHDLLKGRMHRRSGLDDSLKQIQNGRRNWFKVSGDQSRHVQDFVNRAQVLSPVVLNVTGAQSSAFAID